MKQNYMVGDYALHQGKVIKIAAVHLRKVGYHNRYDRLTWVRTGLVDPIPITDELLEKIGFEKKDNRYGIYDDYFDFEMYEYNDGIWLVSYHCCEMSLPDEQLLISYVHQLQQAMRLVGIKKEITLIEQKFQKL